MAMVKPAIGARTWTRASAGQWVPPAPGLRVLRKLVVPLALLVLWQVIVELEVYSRGQLPAPLDVVAALRELHSIDLLAPNVLASVRRVLWGFAIGSGVALVLGMAVGLSRTVE